MTERLRISINISNYFQTLQILEKTLSDKNEPNLTVSDEGSLNNPPETPNGAENKKQPAHPLQLYPMPDLAGQRSRVPRLFAKER